MLHAPGMIRWAINGYAYKRDRDVMTKVVVEGWRGVPEAAARALLSKSVPFEVEGDVVVFTA
jgi:hypothetical protein